MHRALVSDLRLPRCADTSSDMAGHEYVAKLWVPERAHLMPVLARALWVG